MGELIGKIVGKKPEWIKKAIKNARQRERYFMKRYGSLDRMRKIDDKNQEIVDEQSMESAMREMEEDW